MLINLFKTLKEVGVPCTLRELLDLISGLEKQIIFADINDFYYWRNHKKTRNMLKNSEPISWEEHNNWYLKSLTRSDRVSLVVLLKESQLKIGCVGFDIKENYSIKKI